MNSKKKDIWYVYTISFEGNIFYIGSTNSVVFRIQEHLSCAGSGTGHLMHYIRYLGKKPVFKIIFHSDNQRMALEYEYKTIHRYVKRRHPLCNLDKNPLLNRIKMPSLKNIPKPFFDKKWRADLTISLRKKQNKIKNEYENKRK